MKIKYFILSGIISSTIFSMTVFAEPEKTEKETEPTIAVTEVSKNVQETTSITESTTAAITTSTTAKTTTPSFYDEILAYVGEENAPILNENLDNNAMTIDSSTIDYSKKSMYTITTRSGDVFYLIINSDGSVYFLNPVDTADLTAMLDLSNKTNDAALENLERIEETQSAISSESDSESEKTEDNQKKSNSKFPLIFFAVIVIAIVLGFIIMKRKKNKNYIEDDFYDEDEQEVSIDKFTEKEVPDKEDEISDIKDDELEEYLSD